MTLASPSCYEVKPQAQSLAPRRYSTYGNNGWEELPSHLPPATPSLPCPWVLTLYHLVKAPPGSGQVWELTLMNVSLFPKKQEAFPGIFIHCVGSTQPYFPVTRCNRASLPPGRDQRAQQTQTFLSHLRGCTLSRHLHVLKWASVVCLGSHLEGTGKRSPTPLVSEISQILGLWLLPISESLHLSMVLPREPPG